MTKTRSIIYDFDGTIFKSPTKEEGEITYMKETGNKFPYKNWWGRTETLLPPIVPEIPDLEWFIKETVESYRENEKDSNNELILMTGRHVKHAERIKSICDTHNLKFHKYFFRGMQGEVGKNTGEIKRNIILNKILHPDLKILEIYEDRPEHIDAFQSFAEKLKEDFKFIEKIIIHSVLS